MRALAVQLERMLRDAAAQLKINLLDAFFDCIPVFFGQFSTGAVVLVIVRCHAAFL
jgi:hypothetical protein